jgi:hypothetical protein
MAGLSAPLAFSHATSAWRTPASVVTLSGPVLSGFVWPIVAWLGRPKWLRPWYARDELAPWRAAREETRMTDQEAWLESGSRVAEQERRVRQRHSQSEGNTP